MRATIIYEAINDCSLSIPLNTALTQNFTYPTYSLIEINKDDIKPCIGCFGCWTKTPGQCIIQDDIISKTNPAFVQSDYVILVSSIHYGCYSATMKRVLDRIIPNILPFFRKYKNEMHHETRYKNMAKQIIIAYGDNLIPAEKETFIKLTKANATNMGIEDPTVYFCTQPDEIPPIIKSIKSII